MVLSEELNWRENMTTTRFRPLLEICLESEVIVAATIASEPCIVRENKFSQEKVNLLCTHIFKNDQNKEIIPLWYSPVGWNPSWAEKNKTVVYFLRKRRRGGEYELVRQDFTGTRRLSRKEKPIYFAKIQEFVQIQQEKDEQKKLELTVEWLVKCAENPITRYETSPYDLRIREDKVVSSDHLYRQELAIDFAVLLNKDQKERILRAILKTPKLTYIEISLLKLADVGEKEETVPFLINQLKKIKDNDATSNKVIEILMEMLAKKLDSEEGKILCQVYKKYTRSTLFKAVLVALQQGKILRFLLQPVWKIKYLMKMK
jgi:hypothetical protein